MTSGGLALHSLLCLSADGQDSDGMLSARLNRITDRWRIGNRLRREVLVQRMSRLIEGISTRKKNDLLDIKTYESCGIKAALSQAKKYENIISIDGMIEEIQGRRG